MLFEIRLKHTRDSGYEDYHTYEIKSKEDWFEEEQDGLPFNFAIEEAIKMFYEEGNSIWQGDSLEVVGAKLLKQSQTACETESVLNAHEKNIKGIEEILVRTTFEIYGKDMPDSFQFYDPKRPTVVYYARLFDSGQYQISWDIHTDLLSIAGNRAEKKEVVWRNISTGKWVIVKDNQKAEVTPEIQEELRKKRSMVLDSRRVRNTADTRTWFELGFDEALKTLGLTREDEL